MRIISQDGRLDLPYDIIILRIEEKFEFKTGEEVVGFFIRAYDINGNYSLGMHIAEYSTEEKVKKVIEMLHEQHMQKDFLEASKFLKEQDVLDIENAENFIEQSTECNIFRFPSDDEIEV